MIFHDQWEERVKLFSDHKPSLKAYKRIYSAKDDQSPSDVVKISKGFSLPRKLGEVVF